MVGFQLVFKHVRLGGPQVRKTRSDRVDADDAAFLEPYRWSSTAPLVDLQRKLKNVLGILGEMQERGFSKRLHLELCSQWESIVLGGLVGPVTYADLELVSRLDMQALASAVLGLHAQLFFFTGLLLGVGMLRFAGGSAGTSIPMVACWHGSSFSLP